MHLSWFGEGTSIESFGVSISVSGHFHDPDVRHRPCRGLINSVRRSEGDKIGCLVVFDAEADYVANPTLHRQLQCHREEDRSH